MRFDPLMPLWALIPLFGVLAVLCVVLLVRRSRQRVMWGRRLLMVLLLATIALRPVTPIEAEQTERMNANVFFVVDRTGSMNAEDLADGAPRLDGVRADMERIMGMTEGARYSILAFDSSATQQLPLTTDAGAAKAWIDTLTTEPTAYSKGSNVDRALTPLLVEISEARRDDPDSSVLVYFLTDGENTDQRDSEPFSQAAGFIDGGAVLGYGTPEGGPMKTEGGEDHGEYITGPDGAQGVSRIDEDQLRTIAGQMGVPYLHRTDLQEPIEGTMEGITLSAIPSEDSREVASYEDWYWVASIPLAALLIWELGETTYRLPRKLDSYDIRGAQR